MNQTPPPHREDNTAGQVEIRITGRLDARWSAWFDGLTLTPEDGTTVIHGPVADQAALFGLLHKLRDVALPLISVHVEPAPADTSDRGRPDPAAGHSPRKHP